MHVDAESILTKKLVCRSLFGYLIGHGLLGVALHIIESCSAYEHGMAILFGLPGLLVGVSGLLLVQDFYSGKWCRRILKIPFLGSNLQVCLIMIPMSIFAAIVLPGEEGYWPLLSVVGVSGGMILAQLHLINR